MALALAHPVLAEADVRLRLEQLLRARAWSHADPWVLLHAEPTRTPQVSAAPSARLRRALATHVSWVLEAGARTPAFSGDVESHPFQVVFLLRRAGLPEDTTFETPNGSFSVAELTRASRARFDPATDPLELPWAVSTLVAEQPGGGGSFETTSGTHVATSELVERLLIATEVVYRDARESNARALSRTACNGTHLVAGLIAAVRHGYAGGDRLPRIRGLVEQALERIEEEPRRLAQQYDRPGTRFYATTSQLTFLGHTLELARDAEAAGLLRDASQRALVERAERELAAVVETLTTRFDLDAMEALNPKAVAIALGDAAHALHGLGPAPK